MKGKIEGIEMGIETEKKRIAFSMLQKGYSDNEIIELTGLSKFQLKYLKSLNSYEIDIENI